MQLHNFNAGPSILPKSVFEETARGVLDLNGTGLSVLEISHRSKEFKEIYAQAKSLVRELLGLDDRFAVLFLTGGASSQFYMSALNLLPDDGTAAYLDSGSWSAKAVKEAGRYGTVDVVASSKEDGYKHIPKGYAIPESCAYLHVTSNNTIFGTQLHDFPEVSVPLVADMSSDIMCRPIDVDKFGLIYAGAQKNLGPAGTTLVIVRKDLLGKVSRDIPTMLDYQTHIDKDSAFNTPPVFPIYATMVNLKWLKENGGLEAAYTRNKAKAEVLYNEIDRNTLFEGVTATEDRSIMNVTFVLKNEERSAAFVQQCEEAGCVGIKGHRSVGGFRASIYNAMPLASVEALVAQMQAFESTHG